MLVMLGTSNAKYPLNTTSTAKNNSVKRNC